MFDQLPNLNGSLVMDFLHSLPHWVLMPIKLYLLGSLVVSAFIHMGNLIDPDDPTIPTLYTRSQSFIGQFYWIRRGIDSQLYI